MVSTGSVYTSRLRFGSQFPWAFGWGFDILLQCTLWFSLGNLSSFYCSKRFTSLAGISIAMLGVNVRVHGCLCADPVDRLFICPWFTLPLTH